MDVPSYFRDFLHAIQPTPANRGRAIQLHSTLRGRLAAAESFEDWYSDSFLYGSYRRNTAVQPIKDVDICVLLDIGPSDHQPQAVVARLRRVLEEIGYEAKTALQRRSVRIDMSGTTLDVVPVVATGGVDPPLVIPDRKLTTWVSTHPKGHLAAATQLNKDSAKRYVPLVKMVKAWHRYQRSTDERPKPKGFTLEALVAAYQDRDAPGFAEQFVNFLDNLSRDCASLLSAGIFPSVPDPAMPGQMIALTIAEDEARRFGQLVTTTLQDARVALESSDFNTSVCSWREIFGPKFPKPRSAPTKLVEGVGFTDDEAGEPTDDVTDIDLPQPGTIGVVHLSARMAMTRDAILKDHYATNGRALTKGIWLRFKIESPLIDPSITIRWTVTNHGQEARDANDLGHVAYGGDTHWEQTKYRGTHTMTCDLLHDSHIIASGKHVVAIKGKR